MKRIYRFGLVVVLALAWLSISFGIATWVAVALIAFLRFAVDMGPPNTLSGQSMLPAEMWRSALVRITIAGWIPLFAVGLWLIVKKQLMGKEKG
jgi:hypothetical protein